MAGLEVGQTFGVLLLPGFGVSSSSPQVPGHPTSICDAGVNYFKWRPLINQNLYGVLSIDNLSSLFQV